MGARCFLFQLACPRDQSLISFHSVLSPPRRLVIRFKMVSFTKFNPRVPKFDLSNRLSVSAPTHPSPKRSEDGPIDKGDPYSYEPLKRFSWPVVQMAILISMGGFVFGFDTGQISGFLAQQDFLKRFGQRHSDGTYYFSNVRSGLVVSLVSLSCLPLRLLLIRRTTAFYWHPDGSAHWRADCRSDWP